MRKAPAKVITIWAFIIVSFLVVVTGCGQPSQVQNQGEKTGVSEIEIFMGEFFFQMEGRTKGTPIELEAGQKYELEFINMGSQFHEVLIGRDVVTEDGQPNGYRRNLLDGAKVDVEGATVVGDKVRKFEVEASSLEELELEPGVVLETEFTVPKDKVGEWEMGCFVPSHYQSGMHIPVIVRRQR